MSEPWPRAIAAGWHAVATEAELIGRRPLKRQVMGMPLVVFNGTGGPVVLADRCPHRGVRLSGGRLRGGVLECPYHGWQFGSGGKCVAVPGTTAVPKVSAGSYPTIRRAGLVWTSLAADPAAFPDLPPEMEDATLDHFWWAVAPSEARVLDAVENLLDPAHPHLLHPWMVRSPHKRRKVQVRVRLHGKGAEAIYGEEAVASAWMPRLLEGHRARSIGRYFAPNIGQVAFENDTGLSVAISVVFTPEDHDRTRPFAHFATPRGRVPALLKRLVLKAFHVPVLRQDQAMLADQARNIRRFGKPEFALGPMDFLGPAIWRLANGQPQPEEERMAEVYL